MSNDPLHTELYTVVKNALENMKAVNIVALDVRKLTTITDIMIVCSGNSDRHTRALAHNVVAEVKAHGLQPVGVEGDREGEWILVDLGDIVVHIMLPRVRDFYQLERLWQAMQSTLVS